MVIVTVAETCGLLHWLILRLVVVIVVHHLLLLLDMLLRLLVSAWRYNHIGSHLLLRISSQVMLLLIGDQRSLLMMLQRIDLGRSVHIHVQ